MNASPQSSEAKNPKTGMTQNHWTGTDTASNHRLEFSGIVVWRIANRRIVERWAYLESPHSVRG